MTHVLLSLLIVATAAPAPTGQRHPEAVTLFECGFEEKSDTNFDQWPDHWTRRRGAGYPDYLPMRISEEPSVQGKRCLRIELDGGAAVVHSPPIDVGALYSYVMEASIKTEKLKHHQAYCTLSFYDAERKLLGKSKYTKRYNSANKWTKVRIGPVSPGHKDARYAVIGLHLTPSGSGEDLRGAALFDDVWLARLPRMTLTTDRRHNIYTKFDQASITCDLSGIAEANPMVKFQLFDVWNRPVAKAQRRLQGKAMRNSKSDESFVLTEKESENTGYAGKVRWRLVDDWKPTEADFGFYRLLVTIEGKKGIVHQDDVTMAFVAPQTRPPKGEFGWTLPRGDSPLAMADLADVIRLAGLHWVKFPVWYDKDDEDRVDRLVWFAERLGLLNVELVGLLYNPPEDLLEHFGGGESPTAAAIFSTESVLWFPSLEPVLTRLSLKVKWWQLGRDEDNSFVGYPNLEEKLSQVKKRLERFGQEVQLGIGWRWLNEMPATTDAPWEFLSVSADPPLTQHELAAFLAQKRNSNVQHWVVLHPLARSEYSLETRAADLVFRMMAAKIRGVDAVFIPDPFDAERGLMREDGTPGELFLPWRTAAFALAGAKPLDAKVTGSGATFDNSIVMPSGSHNQIFTRGSSEAVMIVWADKPTEETIFLGEDIKHFDIWGRRLKVKETVLKSGQRRQIIQVGVVPTFVIGVSAPVARWRRSFSFARAKIPSVFRRGLSNAYRMTNTFTQGASGQITLDTPQVWSTVPRTQRFHLSVGETLNGPFTITLPLGASSGEQKVQVHFDVNTDRRFQFSVFRRIDVGLGDVVIEMSTKMNEAGELEVTQRVTNHVNRPARFKCYLLAPQRRRVHGIVQLDGRGTNKQVYRLSNGKQLLGKSLELRAEEIGGERVLIYHFEAKK